MLLPNGRSRKESWSRRLRGARAGAEPQVRRDGPEHCVSGAAPSGALDRISSYTVSLIKRHYSIDDVLSRVSFHLCCIKPPPKRRTNTEEGRQTVTITEFSNGKGSTAFAHRHRNQEEDVTGAAEMSVFVF